MELDQFNRLALALAIGLLVGVERGWRSRDAEAGTRAAGMRTFALSGLLGGVAALIGKELGGWAFAALALPYAAVIAFFKQREQAADNDVSATAVVAAILVFGLGAYAMVGVPRLAAAAAVAATALLAFKDLLHGWLSRLTWPELRSALILLAMTFVLLPVMPNQAYGPYEAFNPYEIWLLTIVLAGVSFVAYVATKIFGPGRGLVVASMAGALVSSTAVTLNLARQQKVAPMPERLAGAALMASVVMAVRVALVIAALSEPLLERLAPPFAAFGAVTFVVGGLLVWRGGKSDAPTQEAEVKSPLDLGVAFKFAALLTVLMVVSKVLAGMYGAGALLPVSAVAGLADVDAVALTVGRMAGTGADLTLCALAMLLATGVNSVTRSVIASVVGGGRFAVYYAGGTGLALVVAGLAAVWSI